jgi:hypothetical protein
MQKTLLFETGELRLKALEAAELRGELNILTSEHPRLRRIAQSGSASV